VTTHQTVTSAPTATTYQFESGWDAGVTWASGGRHSLAVMNNPTNVAGATNFIFTGASGKYRELKSLDGNCLELDGPIKGVYYVWERTPALAVPPSCGGLRHPTRTGCTRSSTTTAPMF